MKILVTSPRTGDNTEIFDSFFTREIQDKLHTLGDVCFNDSGHYFSKEELMECIADKDIIFTGWDTPCLDRDVLDCAKNLRLIAHTGGTTALVDPSAYDRGITVLSGNTVYAESVAESVIAYALTALRKNSGLLFGYEKWGMERHNSCLGGSFRPKDWYCWLWYDGKIFGKFLKTILP